MIQIWQGGREYGGGQGKRSQRVDAEYISSVCTRISQNINRVIVGKGEAVELLLVALLSEGHVLIEDVRGGQDHFSSGCRVVFELQFQQNQCTPDLLPSDVTGVSVYDQAKGEFSFRPGPMLTQILLADEINPGYA